VLAAYLHAMMAPAIKRLQSSMHPGNTHGVIPSWAAAAAACSGICTLLATETVLSVMCVSVVPYSIRADNKTAEADQAIDVRSIAAPGPGLTGTSGFGGCAYWIGGGNQPHADCMRGTKLVAISAW
jgi:hypothetical protein